MDRHRPMSSRIILLLGRARGVVSFFFPTYSRPFTLIFSNILHQTKLDSFRGSHTGSGVCWFH